MLLITSFTIALMAGAPGPMDAFQLNIKQSHVSMDFEYKIFIAQDTPFDYKTFALKKTWRPATEPSVTIKGTWEFDGEVEHLTVRPDGVQRADKTKPAPLRPVDCMFDGNTFAYRRLDPKQDIIQVLNTIRPVFAVYGPYDWWGLPFRSLMRLEFPDAKAERQLSNVASAHLEREVYEKTLKAGVERLVLHYDPALNFLPRYVRLAVVHDEHARKSALTPVKEFILVDFEASPSGGIVPTEYVDAFFLVKGYALGSDIKTDTALQASGLIQLGHFKTLAMRNLRSPVRMANLADVQHVASVGGFVRVPRGTETLTLDQVKNMIGNKILPSNKPNLPAPSTKLNVPPPPAKSGLRTSLSMIRRLKYIGFPIVAILCVRLWYKTPRKALRQSVCLLSIAFASSGCSKAQPLPTPISIPKLEVKFIEPFILYNPSESLLNMKVAITNSWDHSLVLVDADAGCSCRQLDKSVFPLKLAPGQSQTLTLSYKPKDLMEPEYLAFTISTTIGTMKCGAPLFTLPKHALSPKSLYLIYNENDGKQTCEVIHRTIVPKDTAFDSVVMRGPDEDRGLSCVLDSIKEDKLSDDPPLRFRDTTYVVTVSATKFGTYKDELRLVRSNGRLDVPLVSLPVVWKCTPFLSSTPEKIILGDRPTRAFLRCPDEKIELVKILSSPKGVKILITSSRELTVYAGEDIPGVLDDYVTVQTSAPEPSILRIPIVRYTSSEKE
jgi:hypothetical protein